MKPSLFWYEPTLIIIGIAWVIVSLIIILYMSFKDKRTANQKNFYWYLITLSFVLYVLFLIKFTMFPIFFIKLPPGVHVSFIQIVPFSTLSDNVIHGNFVQLFGNKALLMPLAVFVSLFYKSMGNDHRLRAYLLVLCVSILIELLQLVIDIATNYPSHACDIDDVIANTLGYIVTWEIFNHVHLFDAFKLNSDDKITTLVNHNQV